MSLSSFDQAILRNPDFVGAYRKLAAMVRPEYQAALLKILALYFQIAAGPNPEDCTSLLNELSAALAAPIVVTVLYLERGTPLYMTDELLESWSLGTGACAECERCGYRHPQSIQQCVLRGGMTGEGGCWARRRARVAAMN